MDPLHHPTDDAGVPRIPIPGNRSFPGAGRHWTDGQRIPYRDYVKATIVLTLVYLGLSAIGLLLILYWH